jgi:hypothetical protein
VPNNFPLGKASFKFYYLNKLEYTVELTVVNGGLLSSIQHPVAQTFSGSFFEYNRKLFIYSKASDKMSFYSWAPETNVWEKLPIPLEMSSNLYNDAFPAKVINGMVYFKPVGGVSGGPFGEIPRSYDEQIVAYNPSTGKAKVINLFHTTDVSQERIIQVTDDFAYAGKLYCLTSESIDGASVSHAYRIRVFDPADNSWTVFMDLPNKGVWTSVVNNGQVFLMNSDYGKQESASAEFVNAFYLLNLSAKSLLKKNWITDRAVGSGASYLASFNNRIYVYGGNFSAGYSSFYSALFAVYDPGQDKWSPVSGYSYFTAWVSQTYGFMLPIGDKLYMGLGFDRYTNGNIHGSKINYSIHQVSIK